MNFLDWFIGEAGAAWIIGIIGIVGSLYAWARRSLAPRVIIQEIGRTRLLGISSAQQDKIKVLYTDKGGKSVPIRGLIQREFVLYNSGSRGILEPLEITLSFYESDTQGVQGLWELVTDNPECNVTAIYDEQSSRGLGARIEIPYLNSFSEHKHYITAYLISENDFDIEIASGIGKGWSTYFVSRRRSSSDLEKLKDRIGIVLSASGYFIILVGTIFLISFLVQLFTSEEALASVMIYFKPTSENIDAYLQFEREKFETLQNSGRWEYWKYSSQKTPGLSQFVLAAALLMAGDTLKNLKAGEFFLRQLRGIQPASSFAED